MNKKGHIALAVVAGTAALFTRNIVFEGLADVWTSMLIVGTAAIAGLAPDFDHKTGTASQKIQFSAKHRKVFRMIASFFLLTGFLLLGIKVGINPDDVRLTGIISSGPLLIGAGVLFLLLAHLRSLILSGVGVLFLLAYSIYDCHWMAAFAGFSFLILPLVKHRGVIHSLEFAVALTLGLLSFSSSQPEWIQALAMGFVTGWWAHLLGDCFGTEGIPSMLIKRFKIALHLFNNGGKAENWIARLCWTCSVILWMVLIFRLDLPTI